MTSEDVLTVDNAHFVGIVEHGKWAAHMGVGDGISRLKPWKPDMWRR
jgi:hypothetical protein